jgi:DNA-binding MarR family transcriptional regulator
MAVAVSPVDDGTEPPLPPAVLQALELLPALVRLLRQAAVGQGADPLTLTQYRVLARLDRRSWQIGELAADLDLTPATVSATVDSLVKRGLVERRAPQGDRRTVPLDITEAGRAAARRARQRQAAALLELLDALPPRERRALEIGLAGLQRVLAGRRVP